MNDTHPHPDVEAQVLRWRSRRGLLELELVLQPFVRKELELLGAADRARYARLLEFDDCDIFDWIQGRGEPEDRDLVDLVARIRAANTA
jgi:antitoxin CptB